MFSCVERPSMEQGNIRAVAPVSPAIGSLLRIIGAEHYRSKISDHPKPDLLGKSILIVEDDYNLAFNLAKTVEDAGAIVVGPVPTIEEGLRLILCRHV